MNHILLVEDDEGYAELLSYSFESRSEQFNLTIVYSIKEAKEHLAKYIPDLVIADYVLQDGKGIELIPANRDKPSYPVVIITGQGNEQVAVNAIKAGALDYVVKLEDTTTGMPYICERALREWDHILERKRLEESLKKSEEKYRKLIKTANDAIFIADAKTGIIIDANKRAEELIGLPLEKIVGMHQKQLHPEDETEYYKKIFYDHVLNGNKISEELFVCNKDGSKIPVEISASVLEFDGKNVIQGIFRDITRHKLLEEQLQKLSCAVEQSPSTVVITDIEGNIEYVNPKFTQLTGYAFEEVFGLNPRFLKSGKTPAKTYKELWEKIATGKEWRGEFCNKKKNGELYWESASISPIKDNKGIITHFVAVKEDITNRKQAEEELKTLNESLEIIVGERTVELKNINEELQTEIAERKKIVKELKKNRKIFIRAERIANLGSWEWDLVKDVIHWSDELYRQFGLKPQEFDITNEAFLNFVHPDDREMVKKAFNNSLYKKVPYNINFRIVLKDGSERIIHAEAEVSFDKNGKPIRMYGISQDITERKKAEEQIKASLKEKEVLLNEIHHRVKNNLQIISSFLDLSSMETGDQNTIDLFTDCRNRIDTMAIIHSQLYKSDRFDQIDMEKHTQELSKRLLQIYAMDKTIELDIKSNNVCLAIDRAIPCALILNELISNALKHAYCNKEKGLLCISIQESSNGNLTVSVKDDGVGIPEELDIDRSKTLGLTLVRNLVYKQLKGNIQVLRNGGTEFIIDFKAFEDKEA